jgi:hypothetical protein
MDRLAIWRHVGCAMALVIAAPVCAAIPQSERDVLLALYASTDGGNWESQQGWNGAAGTECSWYGITCDAEQAHVIGIDLFLNTLGGSLPPIDGLTGLARFDVSYNHLTGAIPPVESLVKLTHLDVSFNQLSGNVPPLAFLTNLVAVYLARN